MRAVVVVRDGVLPVGADETIAECDGRVLFIGSDCRRAAADLQGVAREVVCCETGHPRPGRWAARLAGLLADDPVVVLPASPDGRDLAPRLALALERPLLAPATRVSADRIELVRMDGSELHRVTVVPNALVATLQPGVRGVVRDPSLAMIVTDVELPVDTGVDADPEVIAVLPPDAATIDLTEAPRIVGGGAGLDSAERFVELAALARAIGASIGATRVITDRGWIDHDRQIGTTGVVVDPRLYLAFGISGAVQHTSGIGDPDHVISVNTDPHCPMMQLADLAVVSDANATLGELLALMSRPLDEHIVATSG